MWPLAWTRRTESFGSGLHLFIAFTRSTPIALQMEPAIRRTRFRLTYRLADGRELVSARHRQSALYRSQLVLPATQDDAHRHDHGLSR